MTTKTKSILWWFFALLFTLSIATYQRLTGPTYPVKGIITIEGNEIDFKLLRSANSDAPAEIKIEEVGEGVSGELKFKKFEKWFGSGRFMESFLREFERNCQKISF